MPKEHDRFSDMLDEIHGDKFNVPGYLRVLKQRTTACIASAAWKAKCKKQKSKLDRYAELDATGRHIDMYRFIELEDRFSDYTRTAEKRITEFEKINAELLEACVRATKMLEYLYSESQIRPSEEYNVKIIIKNLRAAIAKARGEVSDE